MKIANRQLSIGNVFTLVELLVVIAIIGILASMLLPALTKARDKAKGALCISNLKQVGLGLLNYADESNNWLPMTVCDWNSATYPDRGCWCWRASDYFGVKYSNKNNDVLRCPARNWTGTVAYFNSTSTYSMLEYYASNNTPEGPGTQRYGRFYAKNSGRFPNVFSDQYVVEPQLQEFTSPAGSFIVYEFTSHEVWKGDNGRSVTRDLLDTYGVLGSLGKWHGQRGFFNGAFADGHVENVQIQSACTNWAYNAGMDHAYAYGKMFSITGK